MGIAMKALCLVAHPDDCVIFGYSYIHHHPEMQWHICYLTYTEWQPRGREVKEFWARRGIACVFLGYQDDYLDNENKQISFNEEQARREIGNIIQSYDLVLTHDAHGDYGHIHHVFVHDCARDHARLVTFARPGEGTIEYSIPSGTYTLDELPQHGAIVAGFHSIIHSNSYKEPQCT
jgi:LmbE family N-acetylglucosaminyl deacetylase